MTSVARWVEVHRLAVAGREAEIARDVGGQVGRVWLATSRFADAARLAGLTLTLGQDAGALYDLGRAENATGEPASALDHFGQALLLLYQAAGDRGNEATSLNSIGGVHDDLGDRQQALEYYGQALPIHREVGNRAMEAVTRYNLAIIHRAEGEFGRAVAELEQVVELDRQVSNPELQSDIELLEQVRQELLNSTGTHESRRRRRLGGRRRTG
jgi:tetratricopeptide (TPR) repeat protein